MWGLWSVAGGGFVRVREVLAGFGRFLGVFGRVWSAWGRAEPVGDVLLMVCLVGSVRGQQSCGRLRTPARSLLIYSGGGGLGNAVFGGWFLGQLGGCWVLNVLIGSCCPGSRGRCNTALFERV